MKKLIGIALLATALTVFSGCRSCVKDLNHLKSGVIGLDRVITLYAVDGTIIQQWETRDYVETTQGGVVAFLDEDNKEVKILGTVSVIEK